MTLATRVLGRDLDCLEHASVQVAGTGFWGGSRSGGGSSLWIGLESSMELGLVMNRS